MLKINPSDPHAIIEHALRRARESASSLPYAVQIEAEAPNTDHPMLTTCSVYAGPNHQLHGCIRLEQVPIFLAGLKAAEEPYIRAAGHPGGARKTDHGDLYDYKTGAFIRQATPEEYSASVAAAQADDGRGVIEISGRSVYVV